MKSNREFLDGIYAKAEILESKPKVKKDRLKVIKKYAAVAVAAVLIIAPTIYLNKSTPMEITNDKLRELPQVSRISLPPNVYDLVEQSDVVLKAKVIKIEKSVYEKEKNIISTTVLLTAHEIYKGDNDIKRFKLVVDGGRDIKTKRFQPYQEIFEKDEETLLFMAKKGDKYILSTPTNSKYTYLSTNDSDENYQDSNGSTIFISELKSVVKGLK